VRYSVVVPIFNEAPTLRELHRRIAETLSREPGDFEIIFVDDGSSDGSYEILESIHREDPGAHVRVVRFWRNFGQHPAVIAGFDHARGEILITLDGDLQNPPEEIPKLLRKLEEGYDVAAGVRRHRRDSILRKIPSRIVNAMVGRLTGVRLRDYGCLLRAYRRHVIELLRRFPETTIYFTAMVSYLGVRIGEVDVDHHPRAAGASKYRFLKLVALNFNLLTGYSILPIQAVSLGGIAVAAIGFILSLISFALVFLSQASLWAWALVFSLVFFLFGVQLAALGIMGEYVGRIHIEVKRRPFYLVRSVIEREA